MSRDRRGWAGRRGGRERGIVALISRSKLNCEVLWDDFAYEVRWAVAGDSIVLQLVARLENNEYMSFGLSGDGSRSRMVGGDVVVAWVDKESLRGYAKDYYLDAKSQCSGGRGSCPDENIQAGGESVRLLNAALVNGYSIVTFQRSLKARDELDKEVFTNRSQPVIWAIGPLNSRKEVSYHSLANRGDIFIDFGRAPKWNCPTPESVSEETDPEDSSLSRTEPAKIPVANIQDSARRESRPKAQIPTPAPAPKSGAWEIPPIKCYEPEDGVFYAQMGPTGGKHGYSAITGHVGWGISWYINGLLIPEINVVRGRTYTFIVEGGLDPETPARYHPFYITDDPVGGYQYKTPQERANIQIFAGAVQNKRGEVRPTGVGRLCNWTPDPNAPPADEFTSFGAYQRTLRLECDPGNPGIIQWTVEKDTPDTVYYQCYTHRYLGWKIRVHDDCEGEAASDPVPSVVKAPSSVLKSYVMDSEGSESIRHETIIKPDVELRKIAPNRTVWGANDLGTFGQLAKTGSVKLRPTAGVLLEEQTVNVGRPSFLGDIGKPVTPSRVKTSGYSVSEEPSEGILDENVPVIPVLITPGEESVNAFDISQKLHQRVRIPEGITAENKFREEYKTNYAIVGVQTEEKLKRNNHKRPLNAKPSNKHPHGPNRLPKPYLPGLLTYKPQPFPTAAYQLPRSPIKAHKRPVPSASHKAAHHALPKIPQNQHRINVALAPESQPLYTKKQQSPFYAADLFGSFTGGKSVAQRIPFAHNGGFDPESVQIEGGFKPILNTGVAPRVSSTLIERAALEVPEEPDERVGEEKGGVEDGGSISKGQESDQEEVDLFKNQTPQVFEPIFIPSHPDNSAKKQEEYGSKPRLSLKPRFEQGEIYSPTPNVVPLRSQVRSRQSGSAEKSKKEVVTEKTSTENLLAENIMELIEMYESEKNGSVSKEKFKRDERAEDEVAVADEEKDFYLSPRAEKFLSYDGKLVKGVEAPALPEANPPADISKLPQFVPFKGAIPPLSDTINAKNLPQLRSSKLARQDILPPSNAGAGNVRLKVLANLRGEEAHERKKRSPDHIPGHVGHDHHDHDHHHHSSGSHKDSNLLQIVSISMAALCLRKFTTA